MPIPTAGQLREHLTYDPMSGRLSWCKPLSSRLKIGSAAGTVDSAGRRRVRFLGIRRSAAVFIWCMQTGAWPDEEVDHEDGDPGNDRWGNLRSATHLENMQNQKRPKNNRSGHKGVSWSRKSKEWIAQICVNGERRHLGTFAEISLAAAAFDTAERELRSSFRRI